MRERGRPDAKSLRLFIAIELPADVRSSLERLIRSLRDAGIDRGLRWVRPEGIHITLKFLGSTDEEDLPGIIAAIRTASSSATAFELTVEGVGSFGGPRSLRVIWAGVGGDTAALGTLAASMENALEPLGFARESRRFNAHLTLARVREDASPDERARLHALLKQQAPPARASFRVSTCSLMESQLKQGGAVYTQVASFPLEAQ
jgi:2'-5' RNA ligase